MQNLTSIDSILLDSVTGGTQSKQRQVQNAGQEALFCASLDGRANQRTPGAKWTAARQDLANVCWDNLRANVEPRR